MGTPKRSKCRQDRCCQTHAKRHKDSTKCVEVDEILGEGADPLPCQIAKKGYIRREEQEYGQSTGDPIPV